MTQEQPLELVLTSEANEELAETLARDLLERGLVACVSLHPVSSHYFWKGRLERSEEVQLLIKTRPEHLAELRLALQRLHSYDTPEWIHWPARTDGAYGAWVSESCALNLGEPPPTP
ncbi:divalent-cation tolerance protein CutA [Cyanobium sp. ATX 6F1]|uniref:divalent-cation tolerance protein CutA n=1 Tax=unclassified Cyanobium TaxID=2627006 RepID=UPI0020CD0A92|nr:divalent-cation tolerance protein CutA [Cyanobium sp. ATX 6F1]MCP9915445.1 divalent-cation tolerance protein CutA [Cyanobium sp. ATX 6F1]